MGGLARVLENLPANDPAQKFYLAKFWQMADSIAKIQSGLLDAADSPYPEISGSSFFVYAIA